MNQPTLIRASDGRRMPWKNGGGETIEIAVHPPGAGLGVFDWRVSMARIAVDGPFSAFADIDRTLVILDGAGIALSVGSAEAIRLTGSSAPFTFPADAPCTARLLSGPVIDLNVMTRRSRCRHTVRVLELTEPCPLEAEGTMLVFCREGRVTIDGAALASRDTLLCHAPRRLSLEARSPTARLVVITLLTL